MKNEFPFINLMCLEHTKYFNTGKQFYMHFVPNFFLFIIVQNRNLKNSHSQCFEHYKTNEIFKPAQVSIERAGTCRVQSLLNGDGIFLSNKVFYFYASHECV